MKLTLLMYFTPLLTSGNKLVHQVVLEKTKVALLCPHDYPLSKLLQALYPTIVLPKSPRFVQIALIWPNEAYVFD